MSRWIGKAASVMGVVVLLSVPALGQATQPAGQWQPGGYPETYNGTFYPGAELRALPGARATAVMAAAEFRRAQITLDNSIAEIRRAFFRSPELAAALAEEQAAFDQLNAARQRAMTELRQDVVYQSAVDLKNRLAEQIEDAKGREGVSLEERLAMASVKLSYATSVTAMEASATAADPGVTEARKRLIAAGRRISALYQEYDEAVRTSPSVLAARKQVEDTRIAAVGADALFVEARNVANVAMNYAYNLYGTPQPYIYNSPIYGGFNYGYPVRLGYPIGYPIHYPHMWGHPGPR